MKLFANLSKGRYLQKEHELAAAKRSLYYLWWRYLRCSVDYWWLCQQRGKTKDKVFAATYESFNDVFFHSFSSWWSLYGEKLFAYKVDPPKVSFFDDRSAYVSENSDAFQLVQIPLFLTRSQIIQQVDELFATHEAQALPSRVQSELSVGNTRGMKRQALLASLDVWCLHDAIQRARANDLLERPERFTQYWIGTKLGLMGKQTDVYKTPKRIASDQLAMRVKVNRHLSRANVLIRNVELGVFPVLTEPEPNNRWTVKQQKELQEALNEGQWVCPESDKEEIAVMLGLREADGFS